MKIGVFPWAFAASRRRLLLMAVLVLTVVTTVAFRFPVADPAGSGGPDEQAAEAADSPLGTAERVLVFSVPTLSWADVETYDAPNLRRLLAGSAIADLSTRSTGRTTSATAGYATLNAGTRAIGSAPARLAFVAGPTRVGPLDPDGDPLEPPSQVFEVESTEEGQDPEEAQSADEYDQPEEGPQGPTSSTDTVSPRYDPAPTAEEFARRTGLLPAQGRVFNYGLVSLLQVNERGAYEAEVGALGDALSRAKVKRAVIANGDHQEGGNVAFHREAVVGLMDGTGTVDGGRVGSRLLEGDVSAPFGSRFAVEEVKGAFDRFWLPRSVVLVEASDLVRYEDFRPLATSSQRRALEQESIAASDRLLGRLLEDVDLERDAVVVVAPYAEANRSSLTVFAVHAPGTRAGLLSSGTTRRAGFVHSVDVAPTILSLVGAEVPTGMDGTPTKWSGRGGSFEDRTSMLVAANAGGLFRDERLVPATVIFVAAQILLWIAALLVFKRRGARFRRPVEVIALAVVAWPVCTFLAAPLPFYRWGAPAYWAFVSGAALVLAIAATVLGRRSLFGPSTLVLGFIVAFESVDLVTGGSFQFNAVFGQAPTIAGRFVGLTNNSFSMFVAAALLLAPMLAHRIGGRRGAWTAIGLLAWCVIVDGAPFWGADVGGVLALVPAAGVSALLLLGLRIRGRAVALLFLAGTLVIVAFGIVDVMRPVEQRSHLGRLFSDVDGNGFGALWLVIFRKFDANLAVITRSAWTLMVPAVFAGVGWIIWRSPGILRDLRGRFPGQRAAVGGLLVAMLLGFALNDSGISVPGMMIGIANAWLVHLVLRLDSEDLPEPFDAEGESSGGGEGASPGSDVASSDVSAGPQDAEQLVRT